MKHEAVILPTTAAVTTTSAVVDANRVPINGVSADVNATEADKVEFVLSGVQPLGAAETVLIFTVSSTGANVPVYDQSGAQAQLKNTLNSIMLEGGLIYRLVKSATVAASGVDVYLKPRTGK